MNRPISAIAALLLVSSTHVAAQVYRCEINGKVLYTDRQCPSGEEVAIEAIDPERAAQAQRRLEEIRERRAEEREAEARLEQERALREAEIEAQRRAAQLEAERQEELLRLERERRQTYYRSLWDYY